MKGSETIVVVTLGAHGCGHPALELAACWVQRERGEWRIAEIGAEESRNWWEMWRRWYAWLRRGDPHGRIEVAVNPQVSEERANRLRAMVRKFEGVQVVPWCGERTEDVAFFAPVGRRGPDNLSE